MTLERQSSPHLGAKSHWYSLFIDALIALAPVYFMATYYYGFRVLFMGLISALFCLVIDLLCIGLRNTKNADFSALITGLIIPLFAPASIPLWMVLSGCFVAILIAKQPFGGLGNNIFNPAAAGVTFMLVAFTSAMTKFPMPFNPIPLVTTPEVKLFVGAGEMLKNGSLPSGGLFELLLGNIPGPSGATNGLVIAACLLYLLARRASGFYTHVGFFTTISAFFLFMPRAGTGTETYFYELLSGTLLLGMMLMLSDPVTTPRCGLSQLVFGIGVGVITMVFERFSSTLMGITFGVLIMNVFVLSLDRAGFYVSELINRRYHAFLRTRDREIKELRL